MANERLSFGGVTMEVLATADDTGGSMTAIVEIPPLMDTPTHTHANEDELFVALEGEHVITVGAEERRIGPGQVAFAPRGIPHSQRRVVEGEGKIMFVCTPGGLEGFFRALSEAEDDGRLGPDAYAEASERYGITWA
jgi:mannose-6-phosphate isomerase-like protein (cupin superfamily)